MVSYTLGPWTTNLFDSDFVDVEAPLEGDIVGIVATCPTGDYGRDAAEANARLIAAAPDLLRLLGAWAAECRQYVDPSTGDPEGDDILAPVLLETDALIARVEGHE
jgi:hypothetical protein